MKIVRLEANFRCCNIFIFTQTVQIKGKEHLNLSLFALFFFVFWSIFHIFPMLIYTTGCISEISNFVSESVEEQICEAVNDLTSEKINDNSIFLCWSEPESDLPIEGYHIYRNDTLLTNELISETTYLDENLPNGDYNYYVVTHCTNSCISNPSNLVEETINLGINELFDEIVISPNPTTGELQVTSDRLQVTSVEIFDIYGRSILSLTPLISRKTTINIAHLQAGIYFVKLTTEKGVITKKIIKH